MRERCCSTYDQLFGSVELPSSPNAPTAQSWPVIRATRRDARFVQSAIPINKIRHARLVMLTSDRTWHTETPVPQRCTHLDTIRTVTPSAAGCEDCLRIGSEWLHLRLCRTCGHVGCCDQSQHQHAKRHFEITKHPIIEGYDPPEGWGWCYVDEAMFDLRAEMTPHLGEIPREY